VEHSPVKLLVVDDDPITCKRLEAYFMAEGYVVFLAHNGQEMWQVLNRQDIAVLLLDVGLPGKDGLELARELRARDELLGIILVSGRDDDVDKIVGLESGADDYVTKPFNARELLARVKIVLRGARRQSTRPVRQNLSFGRWQFDVSQRRLSDQDGQQEVLTRGELEVLSALATHPGEVLSRERLMQNVSHRSWDPGDRTIDVLISRLRDKLEEDPKKPKLIVTVRSEGYVLMNEVSSV
jgi:two-component system torCAD operon response regulator TorR